MNLDNEIYAFKDFTASNSTSGGAFPAIADLFFKQSKKSKLYGVRFDDDFNVVFDSIDSFNDINRFKGSKYVRARIGDCFKQIDNDLNEGWIVLFCGLPCQVSSLIFFLKNNSFTNNLVTIDLVCHGSPKTMFWNDYKGFLESKNGKMTQYVFRFGKNNKSKGSFKKTGEIINNLYMQCYMELFAKNLILDRCCFDCRHKNKDLNRPGDITIGDFWGANYCFKNNKLSHNVSLVKFNTKKSIQYKEMLSDLPKRRFYFKRSESKDWMYFNKNMFQRISIPADYDLFWDNYKTFGLEKSLLLGRITFRKKIRQFVIRIIDFFHLKLFFLKLSGGKKNEILL